MNLKQYLPLYLEKIFVQNDGQGPLIQNDIYDQVGIKDLVDTLSPGGQFFNILEGEQYQRWTFDFPLNKFKRNPVLEVILKPITPPSFIKLLTNIVSNQQLNQQNINANTENLFSIEKYELQDNVNDGILHLSTMEYFLAQFLICFNKACFSEGSNIKARIRPFTMNQVNGWNYQDLRYVRVSPMCDAIIGDFPLFELYSKYCTYFLKQTSIAKFPIIPPSIREFDIIPPTIIQSIGISREVCGLRKGNINQIGMGLQFQRNQFNTQQFSHQQGIRRNKEQQNDEVQYNKYRDTFIFLFTYTFLSPYITNIDTQITNLNPYNQNQQLIQLQNQFQYGFFPILQNEVKLPNTIGTLINNNISLSNLSTIDVTLAIQLALMHIYTNNSFQSSFINSTETIFVDCCMIFVRYQLMFMSAHLLPSMLWYNYFNKLISQTDQNNSQIGSQSYFNRALNFARSLVPHKSMNEPQIQQFYQYQQQMPFQQQYMNQNYLFINQQLQQEQRLQRRLIPFRIDHLLSITNPPSSHLLPQLTHTYQFYLQQVNNPNSLDAQTQFIRYVDNRNAYPSNLFSMKEQDLDECLDVFSQILGLWSILIDPWNTTSSLYRTAIASDIPEINFDIPASCINEIDNTQKEQLYQQIRNIRDQIQYNSNQQQINSIIINHLPPNSNYFLIPNKMNDFQQIGNNLNQVWPHFIALHFTLYRDIAPLILSLSGQFFRSQFYVSGVLSAALSKLKDIFEHIKDFEQVINQGILEYNKQCVDLDSQMHNQLLKKKQEKNIQQGKSEINQQNKQQNQLNSLQWRINPPKQSFLYNANQNINSNPFPIHSTSELNQQTNIKNKIQTYSQNQIQISSSLIERSEDQQYQYLVQHLFSNLQRMHSYSSFFHYINRNQQIQGIPRYNKQSSNAIQQTMDAPKNQSPSSSQPVTEQVNLCPYDYIKDHELWEYLQNYTSLFSPFITDLVNQFINDYVKFTPPEYQQKFNILNARTVLCELYNIKDRFIFHAPDQLFNQIGGQVGGNQQISQPLNQQQYQFLKVDHQIIDQRFQIQQQLPKLKKKRKISPEITEPAYSYEFECLVWLNKNICLYLNRITYKLLQKIRKKDVHEIIPQETAPVYLNFRILTHKGNALFTLLIIIVSLLIYIFI